MRREKEHFVSLIEIGMPPVKSISGHAKFSHAYEELKMLVDGFSSQSC